MGVWRVAPPATTLTQVVLKDATRKIFKSPRLILIFIKAIYFAKKVIALISSSLTQWNIIAMYAIKTILRQARRCMDVESASGMPAFVVRISN